MMIPKPEIGFLHYVIDDDEGEDCLEIYKITTAEFNFYIEGGNHWITFYVRAEEKLQPEDDMNPEPWIELNIRLTDPPESRLHAGAALQAPDYDEELGNLASMYYWSHQPFENGRISIEILQHDELTAQIEGDDTVLRAVFCRNPARRRSFS